MQYAKMVDLLQAAERAGSERTVWLNQAFEHWLGHQNLGEITEEEEEALQGFYKRLRLNPLLTVACLPTVRHMKRGGREQANCLRT